jgi:hypothetical protein
MSCCWIKRYAPRPEPDALPDYLRNLNVCQRGPDQTLCIGVCRGQAAHAHSRGRVNPGSAGRVRSMVWMAELGYQYPGNSKM